MNARKSLLEKIKALLAKTVANGCTEAEALAAMEKARAMMAEYEVTDTDLSFGGEQVRADHREQDDRNRIRGFLSMAVAEFCGVRAWSRHGGDNVVFCGIESDTVFAHWLLNMLDDFVKRELAAYLASTYRSGMPRVRRTETNGFVIGCTNRISARLKALAPKAVKGDGRSLVVARSALINAWMADHHIMLSRPRRSRLRSNRDASSAGMSAGDQARFDRPVNGGAPVHLIAR